MKMKFAAFIRKRASMLQCLGAGLSPGGKTGRSICIELSAVIGIPPAVGLTPVLAEQQRLLSRFYRRLSRRMPLILIGRLHHPLAVIRRLQVASRRSGRYNLQCGIPSWGIILRVPRLMSATSLWCRVICISTSLGIWTFGWELWVGPVAVGSPQGPRAAPLPHPGPPPLPF